MKNTNYIRRILFVTTALLFLHVNLHASFTSEKYYIDNNYVLLYKIINWWYDSLPEDSNKPCGSHIKYNNEGNVLVEYKETEKKMKLRVNGGFTDMLSILKQCESCLGPSYLKCARLNKKYFRNGEADNITRELSSSSVFTFNKIDKIEASSIRDIEEDITISVEGVIGGLMNGKIALHQSGDLFKICPEVSQVIEDSYPISLKIINSSTNEVLVEYSAVWEH